MTVEEINPFLRYAGVIESSNVEQGERCAPDCRLFYFFDGKGVLRVQGKEYKIEKNLLIYVPATVVYDFRFPDEKIRFIALDFDFTQADKDKTQPYPSFKQSAIVRTNPIPDEFLEPILLKDGYEFEPSLNKICSGFFSEEPYYLAFASSRLKLLLLKLITKENFGVGDGIVQKIIEYIQANYLEPIKNQDVADYFNYHPNHVNRLIKRHTGLSFKEFVIRYRVNVAKGLLSSTDFSISRIAQESGFSSPSYFAEQFLKVEKLTPRAYREKMKNSI